MRAHSEVNPYVVVAAAGLILFISMGLRQSFGIFMQPLGDALGIQRETFGLAIAIQNLVFGLPLAGYLSDRYSARRVVAIGALVYAASMFLMGQAGDELWVLATLGVATGVAQSATTFVVVLGAVGRVVPDARRGTVFGIVSALASLGLFGMVPLGGALLAAGGWAWAFEAMGWIALLIVAGAWFLPGVPRDAQDGKALTLLPLLGRARGHTGYLLLITGFYVCGFHVAFIATHLPAYAVDRGLDAETGTASLALIGLFNVAGTLLFGWLADRMRKRRVLGILYSLRAVVIAGFIVVPLSEASALAFGALIGLLWLATVPITSGLVGQMFGPRYLGTLYGVVFLGHQVGAFTGAWWAGYMFDSTGSYDLVWWTAVGLSLLAAALHLVLDDRYLDLQAPATSRA